MLFSKFFKKHIDKICKMWYNVYIKSKGGNIFMYIKQTVTEYILYFKEGTPLYEKYDGEFISEDDRQITDDMLDKYQEQVELYIQKTWERENDNQDWVESYVDYIYEDLLSQRL